MTSKDELKQLLKDCINEMPDHESNMRADEDELMTVDQIADFFQVTTTTIHNWKNEGIIPFIKIKTRIRFRKSDVLAFDEDRKNQNF